MRADRSSDAERVDAGAPSVDPGRAPQVLVRGLDFPEAPRWHGDRLWFSDVRAQRILSISESGDLEVEVELDTQPSGLGFMPDGSLLVVSVTEQKVLRVHGGRVGLHADLRGLPGLSAPDFLNDMVVTPAGDAYVGSRVPNIGPHAPMAGDVLIHLAPDGTATVVERGLDGTNGMVLVDDLLVIAETNGRRLSARRIQSPTLLDEPFAYGDVQGAFPDGISADAEDGVWVASVFTGPFVRVARGGAVTHTVRPAVGEAVACELGGRNGDLLFLCCADAAALRRGWDEAAGTWVPVEGPEPHDSGTIQVVRAPFPRRAG